MLQVVLALLILAGCVWVVWGWVVAAEVRGERTGYEQGYRAGRAHGQDEQP